jgi:hypothetical protein
MHLTNTLDLVCSAYLMEWHGQAYIKSSLTLVNTSKESKKCIQTFLFQCQISFQLI